MVRHRLYVQAVGVRMLKSQVRQIYGRDSGFDKIIFILNMPVHGPAEGHSLLKTLRSRSCSS